MVQFDLRTSTKMGKPFLLKIVIIQYFKSLVCKCWNCMDFKSYGMIFSVNMYNADLDIWNKKLHSVC